MGGVGEKEGQGGVEEGEAVPVCWWCEVAGRHWQGPGGPASTRHVLAAGGAGGAS